MKDLRRQQNIFSNPDHTTGMPIYDISRAEMHLWEARKNRVYPNGDSYVTSMCVLTGIMFAAKARSAIPA